MEESIACLTIGRKMKILYITTVGGTMCFFEEHIHSMIEDGDTIDIASNTGKSDVHPCYREWGCHVYPLSCSRSLYNKGNLKAIKEIQKILEEGKYDIVHCHTPIAAACTRIACRKFRKIGIKVIYTAHGFHFCKNAPKKNWLMFYPAEWMLAHWTDVLITINEEDYVFAQKHIHAKQVEYVPGVGIDLEKFAPCLMMEDEKSAKRASLGLSDKDKVFVSVGELNKDKNHILMIKALQKLKNESYKYIICGAGGLKEEYEAYLSDNGLKHCVKLLGFRTDISEILQIADVFVFPSTFEGLPVSLMEAIASKVMAICSASRGNTDLVKDKRCLFDYRSVDELIQAIRNVESMSFKERNEIIEDNYSRLLPREKSAVIARMKEIYKETEVMGK